MVAGHIWYLLVDVCRLHKMLAGRIWYRLADVCWLQKKIVGHVQCRRRVCAGHEKLIQHTSDVGLPYCAVKMRCGNAMYDIG